MNTLEKELRDRYIGKELPLYHRYGDKQVIFDTNGNLLSRSTSICSKVIGPFKVAHLVVAANELRIESGVMTKGEQPVTKPKKSDTMKQVLVIRSDQAWDRDRVLAAIDHLAHPVAAHGADMPEEATPAPPGSDQRIAFFLNGEPVYRVSSGITPPRAISHDDPEYSEEARHQKVGGETDFRVVVDSNGIVPRVWPAGLPLGFGLDEKAMQALRTWHFAPAQLGGKPIAVLVTVNEEFCLY